MKISRLEALHKENGEEVLEFSGICHDCGRGVSVKSERAGGGIKVAGGALYETPDELFFKCSLCFEKEKNLKHHRECEVYSRIVGYLRPVSQWNSGKLSEFKRRKCLKV